MALAALSACGRPPEYYRPPEQRNPYELSDRKTLSHFVALNAPNAPDHFVADVVGELNDGSWRWVMKRPTFQFRAPTNRGLKLRVDLTVPDITFAQTGPVRIEIMVGGHKLDTVAFDKPEQRLYEKAVPAEWIVPGEPVLISLEIDKMWKSPTDGLERGFIITKIGFVQ
jgi:hypothetical protein